ncbi:MAG: D-hexose-6-phosphate mutarotase [Methylococcales bacterium]|nr:D-hexose-6-phosphate mutarotase [Methylococcales bacterium]
MNIEQLNSAYGIANQLMFIEGKGNLPFIQISNRSATALISLYAGQVLSFQPAEEHEDMLFLSQKAYYEYGKAIRGGIPVCWPWFGEDSRDLQRPNHGFARNSLWTVLGTEAVTDLETKVKLGLIEANKNEKLWQQAFALELEISVGNSLTLELITRNTGNEMLSITQAFHTYFQVGDIKQVKVVGLENTRYFDKLEEGVQKAQIGAVTFSEEVDRIYTDVKNELIIGDSAFDRRIRISSSGSKTAVVWNPWLKTSATMADLEDDDYQRFLCVETGNVGNDIVQIPPGSKYSLLTRFQIIRD